MSSGLHSPEPVAIVGIGCRFPGGVDGPASLWNALSEELDAISEVPASRFDADELFSDQPATPGRIMSRFGGFVDGIEQIDADFFGLSPREADRLDPQQRLLMETMWEALEDGGLTLEQIAGSRTGIFIGMWQNDYESRLFANTDDIDFHMTTGSGRYSASGRLSYLLDAIGPSITVDTASSSSLVAVHLGVESLRTGESNLVLTGGANIVLEPNMTIAYSQSKMMAPDGHCKFGDASANGYVRSDGAGVIALKRLSDALADRDHVYAVIRGSAVTSDGRSSGYLATPGQAGQEETLRRAYERAGVDPSSIGYIEAHGTGAAAGDPVELQALGTVVGTGRPAGDRLLVGSIKTNIGHAEAAAGIAGLIKTALVVEHAEIPASLHLTEPNPAIPWDDLELDIPTEHRAWPDRQTPRRAGVSSFGITGTNAHVVLEQAPPTSPATAASDAPKMLVISARSVAALSELATEYAVALEASDSPGELIAAAALRRSHLEKRLAILGDSADSMSAALRSHAAGAETPGTIVSTSSTTARVVFVFSGLGSQWLGMARELMETSPAFRDAFADVDAAVIAEAGWSPIHVLTDPAEADWIDDMGKIQPLLFAVGVALAAHWRSWGVEPDAVVGHSMGEIAAAHVAGALSLRDATSVICTRGTLLRQIKDLGGMAVVELSFDETSKAIADHLDVLSVAGNNSPRSTLISGQSEAIEAVMADLDTRNVFCRKVNINYASHSPQTDALLDELQNRLADLTPRPTTIDFESTVEGCVVPGEQLGPDYWARNLREPVRFSDAVADLGDHGSTVYIEMSPHPVLLPAIGQTMSSIGIEGAAVGSLRRNEPEQNELLHGLATAYVAGATVDWAQFYSSSAHGQHADLPRYPWQRERFWFEPTESATPHRRPSAVGAAEPSEPPKEAVSISLADRALKAVGAPARRVVMEAGIMAELAAILRLAPDRIDRGRTFEALGLDSLLAQELRNRLESETGILLSATMAFNHPTVAALATHLVDSLEPNRAEVDDHAPSTPLPPIGDAVPTDSNLDELSSDDLASLLAAELAATEGLFGIDESTP